MLLFFFMLISLLMMSDALQNSERFSEYYSVLLGFNAIGLLVLVALIAINLRNLVRQLRHRVAGARMTLRIVVVFAILSVTPVLVVYYFSLDFLNRGIDNWFDLRVENVLDDSLELSKLSFDQRMKEVLKQAQQIAEGFAGMSEAEVPFEIDEFRVRYRAEELTLMTRQGHIIASSVGDPGSLVPDRPDDAKLLRMLLRTFRVTVQVHGHDPGPIAFAGDMHRA